MVDVPERDFGELVEQALDQLPPAIAAMLSNVAVIVEDEDPEEPDLLGHYDGVPLTERGTDYFGVLPDRVTIYRLPILDMCSTYAEVVHEVRTTVVHELAHHLGIDDDRLDELGYA